MRSPRTDNRRAGIIAMALATAAILGMMNPRGLLATVDYGAINHITKECGVLEDGGYYDEPIGWHSCGEACRVDTKKFCDTIGYSYVGREIPHTIETILAAAVAGCALLVVSVVLITRRAAR